MLIVIKRREGAGRHASSRVRDAGVEFAEGWRLFAFVDDRLETVRACARLDRQRIVLHDVDELVVGELEGVTAGRRVWNKGEADTRGDQMALAVSEAVIVDDVKRQ